MKIYEVKDSNTKVILQQGNIEDATSDLLVNWCNTDLRSGPSSFYRIHHKAGPELFKSTILFDDKVRESDCFSTQAGLLDVKWVLHTVLPQHRGNFLQAFLKMANTIIAYKQENVCRSLSIYIPAQPELCLAGIAKFLLDIGLREVTIFYLTDNEFAKIDEFLVAHVEKKKTRWQKIDEWILQCLKDLPEKKVVRGISELSIFKRWSKKNP